VRCATSAPRWRRDCTGSYASGWTLSIGSSIARRYFALTQTSVYPREIVKAALAANAAAVIFAHNHPSGAAQPSQADELLTRNLKDALALVEIKVLDHFIVAGTQAISFAERGLL
jgi:DNA repair protein RadC